MAGEPKARRYAQAVFQIALERDALDDWAGDLTLLAAAASDRDFAALLEAPGVALDMKLGHIGEVLANAGPLARNLLGLLAQRGQVHLAPAIREEFGRHVDEHRGVARADVVTAVALDDAQRGRVERFLGELSGKRVVVAESVDGSILGGIVARVGDVLVDGSLRTRLRVLGETLDEPPERRSETI